MAQQQLKYQNQHYGMWKQLERKLLIYVLRVLQFNITKQPKNIKGVKTMFYKTEIGARHPDYTLYFANISDLMDYLQDLLNLTANEIEFSDAWRNGEVFTVHDGNVDKSFCDFHNVIDENCEYELND
tara:strand:- start:197 stop:577 length:381 start_codon:yes stop_codon:yes gene_type:complete